MPEIQALLNVLNWELCVILRLTSPGTLVYRAVKGIPCTEHLQRSPADSCSVAELLQRGTCEAYALRLCASLQGALLLCQRRQNIHCVCAQCS